MPDVQVDLDFKPSTLRAFSKNEAQMEISAKNTGGTATYWCECEVMVSSPLSLAHDTELTAARVRMGILKPSATSKKVVRLYTRPNNYPDDYKFNVIAFFYDEDGAIAQRVEKNASIMCVASTEPVQ